MIYLIKTPSDVCFTVLTWNVISHGLANDNNFQKLLPPNAKTYFLGSLGSRWKMSPSTNFFGQFVCSVSSENVTTREFWLKMPPPKKSNFGHFWLSVSSKNVKNERILIKNDSRKNDFDHFDRPLSCKHVKSKNPKWSKTTFGKGSFLIKILSFFQGFTAP